MKTNFEMAKEAGLRDSINLERFAELVRAEEREACAKVCDDYWKKSVDCGDKAGALQCIGIRTSIRARGNT